MNLAVISLMALLVAIALGYFKNMNVGIVSIALSMILGLLFNVSSKDLLKGFSTSLFFQMAGITFLFGIVKANGTLELTAKKIIHLVGTNPVVICIATFFYRRSTQRSWSGSYSLPCNHACYSNSHSALCRH